MDKKNSHIKIGFAFLFICIAAGVILFFVTRPTSENDETVKDQSIAQVKECKAGLIQVGGNDDFDKGALELSTMTNDGEASQSKFYQVDGIACVPEADLISSAREAGASNGEILYVEIGYDPKGSLGRYRTRASYEPDIDGDLTNIPKPPAEMKFGDAEWTVGNSDPIAIQWLDDFRAQLEELNSPDASDDTDDPYYEEDSVDGNMDRYSAAYNQCMNSGDAARGVTSGMMYCIGQEIDLQDSVLNKVYKVEMARLDEDGKVQLRGLQRKWIAARDQTCKSKSEPEAGGSLAGIIYASCILEQTAQRTAWLEQY